MSMVIKFHQLCIKVEYFDSTPLKRIQPTHQPISVSSFSCSMFHFINSSIMSVTDFPSPHLLVFLNFSASLLPHVFHSFHKISERLSYITNILLHVFIDPCATVKCLHEAVCKVNADDSISCACLTVHDCPSSQNLICAGDGKSYLNECYLKAEICRTQKDIKIVHGGRCGKWRV